MKPTLFIKRLWAAVALLLCAWGIAAQAAPTVNLTSPGDGWSYNAPVNLNLAASASVDPNDAGATLVRVEFYANGVLLGSDTTSGYRFAWNSVPVGTHVLTAKAIDSLGQEAVSAPRTLTITDSSSNQAPTVNLTAPANNAKYALPADITLSANAADIEKNGSITLVEFLVDGIVVGSATAKPYSIPWNNPSAGSHTLTARATDVLGAQSVSAPRTVTVEGSNTPPMVTLGGVPNNAKYALPVDLPLTATASGPEVNTPVVQVEILANDQVIASFSAKPYSFTWSNPPPGTYTLTARATDSQGLTAISAARTVTINAANTPPTVNLTAPANNSTYVLPADLVVSANATDAETNGGIGRVDFLANGQLIGSTAAKPYSIIWSNPAPGSYVLVARAVDTSGDQSDSTPRTVTLSDSNAPPKVSLTAPKNNGKLVAQLPVQLTATASGPEANTPITLVEFLVDGTVVGSSTVKPYAATWQSPVSGTHQLLARATDSLGAITLSRVIAVSVEAPPAVSLTSPAPGTVAIAPATLMLTASASDPDGTIAKVEFFSGGTLIGTAMTAPYAVEWANVQPGSYSLTAVATDSQGLQTTSAPVNVSVVANHAPTVSLTSPASGLSVKAPATISLAATASDEDNNLVKVEFFQNGSLLQTLLTPPYAYDWANVPQGSYSITAVATDALGAQATSTPVSISVTPAKASQYFIHPDHLGTPRLVTDQANAIVWRHLPTTEPFGNSPPEEDPNGTGQRFELPIAFPGQFRDRESNSNYNFYRDLYFTSEGRYGQSDPIGLNGGINTYGYVEGDPVSYTDPEGLNPLAGAGGGGAASGLGGLGGFGGRNFGGRGDDGSFGGLLPPGTLPGNTGNNGGPMSRPDPTQVAPGNQADTAIQQKYNNYASNMRMSCKDPDDRCKWLKDNARYFPAAAVQATAKAWGCRGSRWSGGNKF